MQHRLWCIVLKCANGAVLHAVEGRWGVDMVQPLNDDADEHADFEPMDDESLIVNELDSLIQDNPAGTTVTVLKAKPKVRADTGSLLQSCTVKNW